MSTKQINSDSDNENALYYSETGFCGMIAFCCILFIQKRCSGLTILKFACRKSCVRGSKSPQWAMEVREQSPNR